MKAFLASAVFFIALLALTGFVYERWVNLTASEAYSTESVRLGGEYSVEGNREFAPEG